MRTGDGWLARLALPDGMTPRQLAALAEGALRFGNGMLEVTARGSLQIRGPARPDARRSWRRWSRGSACACAPASPSRPVRSPGSTRPSSPTRGRSRRRSARGGAAALAGRLGPKVAVVVDGGGVAAPRRGGGGRAAAGGRRGVAGGVGGTARAARPALAEAEAAEVALGLLAEIAARGAARARARDAATDRAPPRPALADRALRAAGRRRGARRRPPLRAGGRRDAWPALGRGGRGSARDPASRPGAACWCSACGDEAGFVARARALGPRHRPRRPAARDRRLRRARRPAPRRISRPAAWPRRSPRRPDLLDGVRLHLSGCAKGCARPAGPAVTLVGGPAGPRFAAGRAAARRGRSRARSCCAHAEHGA